VVIENTGLDTFQEAFDRTGRIINITVAPVNDFDPPRLLNYLTAPHVCIYSAALASCAIPGVFDNVPLIIKEPNGHLRPENEWTLGPSRPPLGPPAGAAEEAREGDQQQGQVKGQGQQQQEQQLQQQQQLPPHHHHYSDGSVENDLPMKQLSELFNVNHFIVSQVHHLLPPLLSLPSYLPSSPNASLTLSTLPSHLSLPSFLFTGQCSFCNLFYSNYGTKCMASSSVWSLCWTSEVPEDTSKILGFLCH
jgi:predicted acylesterase/phospholipase RssA